MSSPPQPAPARAIAGTFADVRPVKTRGVVQVVIEIPVERGRDVIDLLGFPQPGGEQWVAIAPLGFDPYSRAPGGHTSQQPVAPQQRDLDTDGQNSVTACVLRCREPGFQRWLLGAPPANGWTEEDAANEVRKRLGIGSRSDIAASSEARRRWKNLLRSYMEATREPPPR